MFFRWNFASTIMENVEMREFWSFLWMTIWLFFLLLLKLIGGFLQAFMLKLSYIQFMFSVQSANFYITEDKK